MTEAEGKELPFKDDHTFDVDLTLWKTFSRVHLVLLVSHKVQSVTSNVRSLFRMSVARDLARTDQRKVTAQPNNANL